MITFLKILLIIYVVITYVAALVILLALMNLKKKMQKNGQAMPSKFSYAKIVPLVLLAPISLPIMVVVVLRLKKKQGL